MLLQPRPHSAPLSGAAQCRALGGARRAPQERGALPLVALALAPLLLACADETADRRLAHARANLHLRAGSLAGALVGLRAAVLEHPDDVDLRAKLARTLFRAQRFGEAERVILAADQAGGAAPELARALAQTLARTGRIEEAAQTLQLAHARWPDDADAAIALGLLWAHGQDLARAETLFRSVLQRDPDHPAALYNLGRLHLLRGERDPAQAAFMRLRDRHAARPWGPYGLALLAARQRDDREACRELERARARGLRASAVARLDEALPAPPLPACFRATEAAAP